MNEEVNTPLDKLRDLLSGFEEAVPLSRLCRIFGVDPKSQRRRVQSLEIFYPYLYLLPHENVNVHPTVMLRKEAIPLWISTLEVNSIPSGKREVILAFKEESMDVLERLLSEYTT